jgi:dihydroflavonol-4-reductase
MILTANHGRIGERNIISDRYMTMREVHEIAVEGRASHAAPAGVPLYCSVFDSPKARDELSGVR